MSFERVSYGYNRYIVIYAYRPFQGRIYWTESLSAS